MTWSFDWSDTGLKAKSVLSVFQHATYEDGIVSWQLCTGSKCFTGNRGKK